MKKMDNKGITLIELLVSFLLVTVASTYFYSTLDVVVKLYKESTLETQEYIDEDYAIRMAEAYLDNKGCNPDDDAARYTKGYKISTCNVQKQIYDTNDPTKIKYTIYNVELEKDSKIITFLYTKEES